MSCTWKNLLYIEDGYAAADDDNMIWEGKKVNNV
jgi:hypothetical protein